MKAVVLEVNGNEAAVLKEDGTIEKINRACQVGEEIILEEKAKIVEFPKKYFAMAASFVVALLIGFGGFAYARPSSYVTIDANLSFEFGLNAFDRVVTMKALSPEGETIAEDYNKKSPIMPSLDEAIALTSELLHSSNYLNNDKASNITVNAKADTEEKSLALNEQAKAAVSKAESKRDTDSDVSLANTNTNTTETNTTNSTATTSSEPVASSTNPDPSVPVQEIEGKTFEDGGNNTGTQVGVPVQEIDGNIFESQGEVEDNDVTSEDNNEVTGNDTEEIVVTETNITLQ